MNWWCAAQGVPWDWTWRAYPGVWLFIGIVAIAYWTVGGGRSVEPRKRLLFWIGLALLWASLDWPLGALGAGYLASIHMVQFLLMALLLQMGTILIIRLTLIIILMIHLHTWICIYNK